MKSKRFTTLLLLSILFFINVTGCGAGTSLSQLIYPPTETPTPTITMTPTLTPTVTLTLTPTATFIPTETPTPVWVFQSGTITCPILLYHHIDDTHPGNRYYISVEDFDAQMNALHRWGYTTISATLLAQAIRKGAELPAKPIIITFDDGDKSVHDNALPIMKKYHQTGVIYLVVNYLNVCTDAACFMTNDEVRDMIDNGWEIGSHTLSHLNLQGELPSYTSVEHEIKDSKTRLEEMFGVQVNTIAYPFGITDPVGGIVNNVARAGYLAGMQASGPLYQHTQFWIYILNRLEVRNGMTLDQIAKMIGYTP